MATKNYTKKDTKNTKKGTKKDTKKDRPSYDLDIKVTRAFEGKYGTLLDMEVNHVSIYGCRVCETRDGEPFIGFPQKQDKKNRDKWWSIAYVPLTDEQTAYIMSQVADLLEEQEGDED